MPGTLAELYAAILRQRNEPQGILSAARINPLMAAKALSQMESRGQSVPYGYGQRPDGTEKGNGYFGPLPMNNGSVMTELSAESNLGGRNVLYPLVNPYLSREQIDYLVGGGKPTNEIYDLAERHAMDRIRQGKNPFAGVNETMPVPSAQSLGRVRNSPTPAAPQYPWEGMQGRNFFGVRG